MQNMFYRGSRLVVWYMCCFSFSSPFRACNLQPTVVKHLPSIIESQYAAATVKGQLLLSRTPCARVRAFLYSFMHLRSSRAACLLLLDEDTVISAPLCRSWNCSHER